MSATTTRRAILAGASALPALAAPTAALANLSPDPIFAAIEVHKLAFLRWYQASKVLSGTVDAEWAPEYDAAVCKTATDAETDTGETCHEAAFALTKIRPTTKVGVLALIDYVDAFNRGEFGLDDDGWRSGPIAWPNEASFGFKEDGIDDPQGTLGMEFAVLLNVRAALGAMAVQS